MSADKVVEIAGDYLPQKNYRETTQAAETCSVWMVYGTGDELNRVTLGRI